jgi:type II secretory pathway predicted ATPase ExeA
MMMLGQDGVRSLAGVNPNFAIQGDCSSTLLQASIMEAAILENQSSSDVPNLKNNPFGRTADGSYPYLSSSFREALRALYYELECGGRILMLVAEPGLGKTTLLHHVARRLRARDRSLYLSSPNDLGVEVLRKLSAEIGGTAAGNDLLSLRRQVDEILARSVEADNPFILLLDPGQNCAQSVRQTLRTLTLLDSFERCLLRVVLAASAELAADLQASEVAGELRRVPLAPLTGAEVASYIDYRLRLAGRSGAELFTADNCAMIAGRSGGNPSVINDICLNLLYQLGEPPSAQSARSSENKAGLMEVNSIDARPSDQPALPPVAVPSPTNRTVALTCVILMLIVASVGLWYRNSFKPPAAKPVAARVAAAPIRQLVSAPPARIALTGPSPPLSPVQLQATPAEPAVRLWPTPAESAMSLPPTPAESAMRLPPAESAMKLEATPAHTPAVPTPAVAAESDRANRAARRIAADEIRRGDVYMNAGEYDQALESFSKAVVLTPHSSAAQAKVERARRAKAAEQSILQ